MSPIETKITPKLSRFSKPSIHWKVLAVHILIINRCPRHILQIWWSVTRQSGTDTRRNCNNDSNNNNDRKCKWIAPHTREACRWHYTARPYWNPQGWRRPNCLNMISRQKPHQMVLFCGEQ
jgi:hypothetical protein